MTNHTICQCELSGELHVLTDNKGCELCAGGDPFTPENVEKAFRFYEKRWQECRASSPPAQGMDCVMVPREPTEEMEIAARPLWLWYVDCRSNSPWTLGDHNRAGGYNLPLTEKEAAASHLPKHVMSRICWRTMLAKAPPFAPPPSASADVEAIRKRQINKLSPEQSHSFIPETVTPEGLRERAKIVGPLLYEHDSGSCARHLELAASHIAALEQKAARDTQTCLGFIQLVEEGDERNRTLQRQLSASRERAAGMEKIVAIATDLINGPPGPHVQPEEQVAWDEMCRQRLATLIAARLALGEQ